MWDHLFEEVAREECLEPWTLKGVAFAESALVWCSYRYGQGEAKFFKRLVRGKPRWERHPYYERPDILCASWGLMQILMATAVEMGFPEDGKWCALMDPETNIRLGAKYLRNRADRYNGMSQAVSAYNAGYPRIIEGTGKFQNQRYVDKVMRASEGYRRAWQSA